MSDQLSNILAALANQSRQAQWRPCKLGFKEGWGTCLDQLVAIIKKGVN